MSPSTFGNGDVRLGARQRRGRHWQRALRRELWQGVSRLQDLRQGRQGRRARRRVAESMSRRARGRAGHDERQDKEEAVSEA